MPESFGDLGWWIIGILLTAIGAAVAYIHKEAMSHVKELRSDVDELIISTSKGSGNGAAARLKIVEDEIKGLREWRHDTETKISPIIMDYELRLDQKERAKHREGR